MTDWENPQINNSPNLLGHPVHTIYVQGISMIPTVFKMQYIKMINSRQSIKKKKIEKKFLNACSNLRNQFQFFIVFL
jgi:hypothetical protein